MHSPSETRVAARPPLVGPRTVEYAAPDSRRVPSDPSSRHQVRTSSRRAPVPQSPLPRPPRHRRARAPARTVQAPCGRAANPTRVLPVRRRAPRAAESRSPSARPEAARGRAVRPRSRRPGPPLPRSARATARRRPAPALRPAGQHHDAARAWQRLGPGHRLPPTREPEPESRLRKLEDRRSRDERDAPARREPEDGDGDGQNEEQGISEVLGGGTQTCTPP